MVRMIVGELAALYALPIRVVSVEADEAGVAELSCDRGAKANIEIFTMKRKLITNMNVPINMAR